jgi:hypothetical protein
MPIKKCFEGFNEKLLSKYNDMVASNPEKNEFQVAREIIEDERAKMNDELNEIRKALGVKRVIYTKSEGGNILKISKEFSDKIKKAEELSNIEVEIEQPITSSESEGSKKIGSEKSGTNIEAEPVKVEPPTPPIPPTESKSESSKDGSKKTKQKSILKNLLDSTKVSEQNKQALRDNGVDYVVSNQSEASLMAEEIVNALGIEQALDAARGEYVDPSVGSAIFAQSLNKMFIDEAKLREQGNIEAANEIAKQSADISLEYANISNKGGKWNAQIAYFYKTSPMSFVLRINETRATKFEEWFKGKEEGWEEVLKLMIESEEGQTKIKEEVENLRKEERKNERKKRDKAISDFFKKAKLKGGTYVVIIPPPIWNKALDIMELATKAGDRAVVAVGKAIEYISKEIGDNWDKEKFRKEYEENLSKVADGGTKEKSLTQSLKERIEELQRRIKENDFSSEAYKNKKELTEEEKELEEELKKVREAYDDAKKTSQEYIDKKAKQFLENIRKKIKGLTEKQKQKIIARSIKKVVESGGLEIDELKDIIADVIGFKKLTPEEIKEIEALTAQANKVDQSEIDLLNNTTKENLEKFRKQKAASLDASRRLFELTHTEADVVSTVSSIMRLNLLGLPSIIMNFASNTLWQGSYRFPSSLIIKGVEYGVYGSHYLGNLFTSSKPMPSKPISLLKEQSIYWDKYISGISNGWKQLVKGVDEKNYFDKVEYSSRLNPIKSWKDLFKNFKGDIFLSPKQKTDKIIQGTIGANAYLIGRLMGFGDKPPRYAAQALEAYRIAVKDIKLTDPDQIEAFIEMPEKYSFNFLTKQKKLTAKEAGIKAKEIAKRIADYGANATFQDENFLNQLSSSIDTFLSGEESGSMAQNSLKSISQLAKAYTIPFLKTPANIYWAFFKLNNPAFSMAKAASELVIAEKARRSGDFIRHNQYVKNAKESIGYAIIGSSLVLAGQILFKEGLLRASNDEDDKLREKIGEDYYGGSGQINIGKLAGGDDSWVSLLWFVGVGTVFDTQAKILDKKKKQGINIKELDYDFTDNILENFSTSSLVSFNSLVFDNTSKIIDGLRKGGNKAEYLGNEAIGRINTMIFGSDFERFSKLSLPVKVEKKADTFLESLKNNIAQRNTIARFVSGYNPPSKIGMWGDPIVQDNSFSGVLRNAFKLEGNNKDKFAVVLYQDQQRTGKSGFFPMVEDNKITVNGKIVEINTEQKRSLDSLIGRARVVYIQPIVGGAVHIGGKNYYSMNDEEKLALLDEGYKKAKQVGFENFKLKYKQFENTELTLEQDKEKQKQEDFRAKAKDKLENFK